MPEPEEEFLCSERAAWMPGIPGACAAVRFILTNFALYLFHKQKIKE